MPMNPEIETTMKAFMLGKNMTRLYSFTYQIKKKTVLYVSLIVTLKNVLLMTVSILSISRSLDEGRVY